MRQLGGINAIQTDYNNDGRLDIFVMRGGWEVRDAQLAAAQQRRRHVHRRDAGGRAARAAARPRTPRRGPTTTTTAGWTCSSAHELTPSQLFRNRGDGTFEDVTARAGVGTTAFTKGVDGGDYDGDGYPDLYVSNMFGENFLYRNNGDGTFTERRQGARRRQAVRQLPHLVLRLRQRRLARHLRGLVPALGRGVRQALPGQPPAPRR